MLGRRVGRLNQIIILLVLGMILARMIWIQLRFFPVNVDYRALVTFGALMDGEDDSACFDQHTGKDQLWALLTDNELVSDQRYRWFRVPGLEIFSRFACMQDAFTPQSMQRINYLFLGGTVFFGMILARMLSGSWVLAFVTAAMLLSRGQLVSKIGELTALNCVMFLCTLMFTCVVHHLRTASWLSLLAALASLGILTTFDVSWSALLLAFPTVLVCWWLLRRVLSLPALRQLRAERKHGARVGLVSTRLLKAARQSPMRRVLNTMRRYIGLGSGTERLPLYAEHAYEPGRLLQPLLVPYSLWVLHRRRWLKLVLYGYLLGALVCAAATARWLHDLNQILPGAGVDALGGFVQQVAASVHGPWVRNWFEALRDPLDLHFIASLLVMGAGLVQSPARGLSGFFEAVWITLTSVVFLIVAAFIADAIDARVLIEIEGDARGWSIYGWSRAPHLFVWMEPLILSLGLVGVYNLMKVADSRFVQSARGSR